MNPKTDSETLFESFCTHHQLQWDPIPTDVTARPDYKLTIGDIQIAVEIKQLDTLSGFILGGRSSRTTGDHVRAAIKSAHSQIKWASRSDMPGLLLIYNARDPWQAFGTEEHDFLDAMYGERTVKISKGTGAHGPVFHGRNAKLRADDNVGFSGVGHLLRIQRRWPIITIYENAHARYPLPFELLKPYFEVRRVMLERIDTRPRGSEVPNSGDVD
ncbi:hypothetical protein [Dyella humicola]|uniref:hypothetical protein n=1 Tax=Dyella humicola TaxID=2992126 RepID=UPI00224C7C45|nr:hypothetical protein [Dyella humicola]